MNKPSKIGQTPADTSGRLSASMEAIDRLICLRLQEAVDVLAERFEAVAQGLRRGDTEKPATGNPDTGTGFIVTVDAVAGGRRYVAGQRVTAIEADMLKGTVEMRLARSHEG